MKHNQISEISFDDNEEARPYAHKLNLDLCENPIDEIPLDFMMIMNNFREIKFTMNDETVVFPQNMKKKKEHKQKTKHKP